MNHVTSLTFSGLRVELALKEDNAMFFEREKQWEPEPFFSVSKWIKLPGESFVCHHRSELSS